jgi:DNA helicase II / ATP-dependent DNA helicase PcrA
MDRPSTSSFLNSLNEPQRNAVLQTEGPVMVIAGAGSGKTRVLTFRIAHLIEKGVDPFNILSLTFTNKAAKEMRTRIEKLVGPEARNLWMGTFHSVFAKILRIEADKLGYPQNFTIYDTEDSRSLIKTIIKEMNLDDKVYKPSLVHSRISSAKNNLITAEVYNGADELTSYDSSTGRPYVAQIYKRYADRCFKSGAMDFDDLLLKTHELFANHLNVLNKYQHRFKYVMVDEYQDTNHCQYMIIKKLAAVNRNICVVGDDAQSIYSFRGATIKNILNYERDYPELQVFKLEQNYRSTQTIVNASGTIIAKNKDQLQKKVWTENDEGDKIKVIRAVSDTEEAKMVAQQIFDTRMEKQADHKAFAILYRTNAQSRTLEEALRRQNIPYRIYGGQSFYQRKEIKDMLAYLKLSVNHKDEEAIKRVINYPARGIGKTTIDKLMVLAQENEVSLWEVVNNAQHFPELKSAQSRLVEFGMMIRSFATMLDSGNAYDVAIHAARSTGLLKTLHEDKTVEGVSRYENLVELLNGIKEFTEDDTTDLEKTLDVYLQDIALITDADKDDGNDDKVSLMTLHAAKGLEFPYVFISGLEENLFPSQMALNSRQDLEEERRLFYVGITRAETKLTLCYATSRFRFGTLLPCEPSRFIEEIDPQYLEMDRRSKLQPTVSPFEKLGKGYGRTTSFSQKQSVIPPNKMPPMIENFEAEDTSQLEEGMSIEHQRFGKGKVTKMEGAGDSRKATVLFDQFGEKQLVLKFAKVRIV